MLDTTEIILAATGYPLLAVGLIGSVWLYAKRDQGRRRPRLSRVLWAVAVFGLTYASFYTLPLWPIAYVVLLVGYLALALYAIVKSIVSVVSEVQGRLNWRRYVKENGLDPKARPLDD